MLPEQQPHNLGRPRVIFNGGQRFELPPDVMVTPPIMADAQPPAVEGRKSHRGIKRTAFLLSAVLAGGVGWGVYELNTGDAKGTQCADYNQEPENSTMRVPAEFDTNYVESIIAKGEWCYMPGVKPTDEGLEVTPTSMAILNLSEDDAGRPPAEGTYSPNLPLNLMSHIETIEPGNLGIATRLQNIKHYASLTFATAPDLRFDERTIHEKQVTVHVEKDTFYISETAQKGAKPTRSASVKRLVPGDKADVVVYQSQGQFVVDVDGQSYSLKNTYFDEKQVWLGLDGTALVSEMNAYPIDGNKVTVTDPDTYLQGLTQTKDGLYGTAYEHGLGGHKIGTAIDLTELMANPEYATFVIANFNELEPAMAGKWQATEPEQGTYTLGELQAIVKFANQHGMSVHGHTLDFTEAYPKWLQDKMHNPRTTSAEAAQILHDHVYNMVKAFDGQDGRPLIQRWDVVNEPFDPDDYGNLNAEHLIGKKIDPDDPTKHIEVALRAAIEANPDGEFYFNEWGETDPDRQEAILKLAKRLSAEKLLDGVGLQGHWFEDDVEDDDLVDALMNGGVERFVGKLTALPNRVGEPLRVRFSETSVPTDGDAARKARIYKKMVQIMRNNKHADFGTWGAANKLDYMTADGKNDPGDDAIATQKKFRTGPIETDEAFRAIKKALAGK